MCSKQPHRCNGVDSITTSPPRTKPPVKNFTVNTSQDKTPVRQKKHPQATPPPVLPDKSPNIVPRQNPPG